MVALEFPKFNDGRAFSQARILRERYGYRGEIRATGKVVRDLLLFMHRCGFDAFETGDRVTAMTRVLGRRQAQAGVDERHAACRPHQLGSLFGLLFGTGNQDAQPGPAG